MHLGESVYSLRQHVLENGSTLTLFSFAFEMFEEASILYKGMILSKLKPRDLMKLSFEKNESGIAGVSADTFLHQSLLGTFSSEPFVWYDKLIASDRDNPKFIRVNYNTDGPNARISIKMDEGTIRMMSRNNKTIIEPDGVEDLIQSKYMDPMSDATDLLQFNTSKDGVEKIKELVRGI